MENELTVNDATVRREINQLENKIKLYSENSIGEDEFKGFRVSRGIHGQRNPEMQMVRLKVPLGRVLPYQMKVLADAASTYGSGILHITSRQDIQLYDVKLEESPYLWRRLEQGNLTIRESGGNVVRNIITPAIAGVDPDEPFDVSPYAYEVHRYFFRNPICQKLGRKFKIAFSTNDHDNANAVVHDLGFIPKVNERNEKGFKVLIGGGLGSAPRLAHTAHEFLKEDLLIPYIEAVLRIFDRHGERIRRSRARLKFLIQDLGLETFNRMVEEECPALNYKTYMIQSVESEFPQNLPSPALNEPDIDKLWFNTSVYKQKQEGFVSVAIPFPSGNFTSEQAEKIAILAEKFYAHDIRFDLNQAVVLTFIDQIRIGEIYEELKNAGFVESGFYSSANIVSCLGTTVCKLAVINSSGLAEELKSHIKKEFPGLEYNNDFRIRANGCPNACCHFTLSSIGFYGGVIRTDKSVLPAVQLVMGGENQGDGKGVFAEKIIKIPAKRAVKAARILIRDYSRFAIEDEVFTAYYRRMGKHYFHILLEHLADVSEIEPSEFYDWNEDLPFKLDVNEGDCAGAIAEGPEIAKKEAEENLANAFEAFMKKDYDASVYCSYLAYIHGAKMWLIHKQTRFSSHFSILKAFEDELHCLNLGFEICFTDHVLRIQRNEAEKGFTEKYLEGAVFLVHTIREILEKSVFE